MKDLIYRLRDWNRTSHERNRVDMLAAADAIEKLEAENAQLKESRDEYSEAVERLSVNREEMLKDRVALAIEIERLKAELDAMKGDRTFAGWFTELDSAMSYRLWEQGGREPGPGDVALYAASGAKP